MTATSPPESGRLRVVAEATVLDGRADDLLPLMADLASATRAEVGNISYVVHRDTTEPTRFVFIEEWANQAAFDGHLRSSHFARYLTASEPLLLEPPRILVAAPLPL
ncbi:putative quinol monooxygenase [Cryobacterium sp. N22]|uniref:putative quinol monooxygenase n=1 Tax=Cryobacterium sp. N22 TaxID=2048290 RepID=UPI001304E634|nr:putative quinol monooxygenase [Cryobacterium sp. N22]